MLPKKRAALSFVLAAKRLLAKVQLLGKPRPHKRLEKDRQSCLHNMHEAAFCMN
jgi:hypothetical protein